MSLSANSLWSPISGGITTPKGFKASGIKAGLKPSGKTDLALLLAPEGAVCAGAFTKSLVRASCIDLCKERLKATTGKIRAVLINSGQANACTGERGLLDNLSATKVLADHLELETNQVLICSTGVIGEPIPMKNLLANLTPLVQGLSETGGKTAAEAILTTDLVTKQVAYEGFVDGRYVRVAGMAKGSGMIHPNMSTMLGYVTCDAGVANNDWSAMIQRVVDSSFNAITVDGDTSTNDSFLAFAAGESLSTESLDFLEIGLKKVTEYLAKAIARDGEGANCLLEIQVEGTETDQEARQIARTIAGSALVKTAIHGCDPNWGRIIAAAGRAGVALKLEKLSLWLGSHQLIHAGQPLTFDKLAISGYIKDRMRGDYLIDDSVILRLVVGEGSGVGCAWGCDLSDQYVRINADYTT